MQLWAFANALAKSKKMQFTGVPVNLSEKKAAEFKGRVALLEMTPCTKFTPAAQMASEVVGYNSETKVILLACFLLAFFLLVCFLLACLLNFVSLLACFILLACLLAFFCCNCSLQFVFALQLKVGN